MAENDTAVGCVWHLPMCLGLCFSFNLWWHRWKKFCHLKSGSNFSANIAVSECQIMPAVTAVGFSLLPFIIGPPWAAVITAYKCSGKPCVDWAEVIHLLCTLWPCRATFSLPTVYPIKISQKCLVKQFWFQKYEPQLIWLIYFYDLVYNICNIKSGQHFMAMLSLTNRCGHWLQLLIRVLSPYWHCIVNSSRVTRKQFHVAKPIT